MNVHMRKGSPKQIISVFYLPNGFLVYHPVIHALRAITSILSYRNFRSQFSSTLGPLDRKWGLNNDKGLFFSRVANL